MHASTPAITRPIMTLPLLPSPPPPLFGRGMGRVGAAEGWSRVGAAEGWTKGRCWIVGNMEGVVGHKAD